MKKTVLITGASDGIGKESAIDLAKSGVSNLILTYNQNMSEALETKEECERYGAEQVFLVKLNLLNSKSIKECFDLVKSNYSSIDILVNNAGTVKWKYFREQSFEEIEDQVRTNLEGLMKITNIFLPLVNEKIINIGSGAGKKSHKKLSTYSSTKFGVRGFTKTLALEEPQLSIYTVNPGMTKTKMTDYQGESLEKVAKVVSDTVKGNISPHSGEDIDVEDHL